MSDAKALPVDSFTPADPRIVIRDEGFESPCWIWLLSKTGGGYGRTGGGLAHCLSWEKHHGRPKPEGLDLDHLCQIKDCCNPDHLEPVTRRENLLRRPVRHTLTRKQVLEIRASDESGPVLGARFGVSRSAICAIRRGRTWADLSDAQETT